MESGTLIVTMRKLYTFTQYTTTVTSSYEPSTYKISSTYSMDTSTGKYILTNPITKTYTSSYVGYYMCSDYKNTTCDKMYQIKEVNDSTYTVTKVDVYE